MFNPRRGEGRPWMPSRRDVLAAIGAAAATAGCARPAETGDTSPATPVPDSGSVAGVALPAAPAEYTYAQMGAADAPVVTYFGNWKCPFCAAFATGSDDRVYPMGGIVASYVDPGRVRLRYRAIAYTGSGQPFLGPDAVRASRFGLAVWASDPEAYWAYHEHVMANQPPERERWATLDRLAAFARAAGVRHVPAIRRRVAAGGFERPLRETTTAAGRAGVEGTPSLVADGRVVSPFDAARTERLLEGVAER